MTTSALVQPGRRALLAAFGASVSLRAAAEAPADAGQRPEAAHGAASSGHEPRGWRPVDAPAQGGVPFWLGVDEAPQRFDAYFPAGGPLQRPADVPGAWYLIVFVALPARWPVHLMAWQRTPSHQLRFAALDGWPGAAAQTVVGLPTRIEPGARGRPVLVSAPFVLAPASQAAGVFVLVEQRSSQGTRPAPLWLQARFGDRDLADVPRSAWWRSSDAGAAAQAPTGSLQARRPPGGAAIELPILRLASAPPRPAPQFEPWWER
jgi:hypothetical protein